MGEARLDLVDLLLEEPTARDEVYELARAAYGVSRAGVLQIPWLRGRTAFVLARIVAGEGGDPARVAALIGEARGELAVVPELGHHELALMEAIAGSAL
jgi:hypothetical protein